MKVLIFLLSILMLAPHSLFAWSKKGHDVICYIAENHLSKRAMAKVTEVLDGRSMVYYSSWMDNASHTPEYDYTSGWHYFNIDKGGSAETQKRSKDGDVLSATKDLVSQLKSGELSAEDESVALKMLIHMVGDMHQPMHLGREDDRGGNNIPVVYFVESTSLHSMWDYHIVMGAHEWSYTEWQNQIDRGLVDEQAIVSGSYEDWANATHEIANEIYRDTPAETRVSYDYLAKYTPIIEQQFLYAGLRLAHILNDIYR